MAFGFETSVNLADSLDVVTHVDLENSSDENPDQGDQSEEENSEGPTFETELNFLSSFNKFIPDSTTLLPTDHLNHLKSTYLFELDIPPLA